METEKTLVLIKPDSVRRGLIGEIIKNYEQRQLRIVEMRMLLATDALLEQHYAEHIGKPFYANLVEFMKSGMLVAMVVEGNNAVAVVRKIHGATNPFDAEVGSIRGLFANSKTENCVHGSDSIESAKRECRIWFD